ncbi:1-acyl-sn-glycerol-3-phosphate acyltransferase [Orenia metallireducens]|jgi:1-acyl-sn-glycerol-3-phosphate acyltransferase|uniref:1-acyl-sn-glycerol-3-phosphate acyltransferase n=1 Tax=Orenia metallireducens TaxID=1413210 RepID=A0A285F4H9_9FIRM|nr:lysophospholipid acyltransferase family protein [Orenia metallireducens]PRX34789.1 1-acyl-sn-glycerol-3-phosphate acyltransferase [Orenia metallireducens]SNY05634.1 1-acyl-sn-glycerol-3-phosphate acyltransferase [Orenia metallireducens]
MNLTYRIAIKLFKMFYGIGSKPQIIGTRKLPKDQSFIVVSNHISNYDPPFLTTLLNRKINFMAKDNLFKNKFGSFILKKLGAFPIKRGCFDRGAIKYALELLKNNQILGIFPEGTRSTDGQLQEPQLGATLLALKSKSPIIPIGIKGTNSPFKENIIANIGEMFTLDEFYDKKLSKEEMKEAGSLIMTKIKELL